MSRTTLHVLINGAARCRFRPDAPADWPVTHAWIRVSEVPLQRMKDACRRLASYPVEEIRPTDTPLIALVKNMRTIAEAHAIRDEELCPRCDFYLQMDDAKKVVAAAMADTFGKDEN